MATKSQPQTALDERVIEDSDLEKILEDRETAKGAASEARAKVTTLDDLAKGRIEELGLAEDDTVRIGRFRVSKKRVEGRSVAFETEPTTRLTISPDKNDE